MGAVKLGQPVPLSNLASWRNSGRPHAVMQQHAALFLAQPGFEAHAFGVAGRGEVETGLADHGT
jgi:hypothetical protein